MLISAEPTPKRAKSVAKSRAAFGGGGSCLCCCGCCLPPSPHHLPTHTLIHTLTHTGIDGCRVSSGHGCELPSVYLIDMYTDRYTLDSWLHNACELGRGSHVGAAETKKRRPQRGGATIDAGFEKHRSKIFLILYKS